MPIFAVAEEALYERMRGPKAKMGFHVRGQVRMPRCQEWLRAMPTLPALRRNHPPPPKGPPCPPCSHSPPCSWADACRLATPGT